jgi:DNA-binding transcriptional ArsR family regulator
MVEYNLDFNAIFGSLADQTRRDILRRVAKKQLTIGEIAQSYKLTFAAVSKHLQVLEKAGLVVKHKKGKQQYVRLSPAAVHGARKYLQHYEAIWNERFEPLKELLRKEKKIFVPLHHPFKN